MTETQQGREYLASYNYQQNKAAFDDVAEKSPGFDIDKFGRRWRGASTSFMFALDKVKGGGNFASREVSSTPPATQRDMWLGTMVAYLADALEDTGNNLNVIAIAWEHTELIGINEGDLFSRILFPALRERGHNVPDLGTVIGHPTRQQDVADVESGAIATRKRIDMALLTPRETGGGKKDA